MKEQKWDSRKADILLSLVAISVLLTVMILCCFAIALTGQNPIFSQIRVGQNQILFKLYKFRTMKGQGNLPSHLESQARITKLGAFLRATKLDELPQLFNVLKGEMSMVGPRPCLPSQHKVIQARASRNLNALKPGITGHSQLSGIDMSQPELLATHDNVLLSEWSSKTYASILIRTVFGFLRKYK